MKKVQIVEKSCHREGLNVQRLRNYFEKNGYIVVKDNHGLDPTDKYAYPLSNLEIDPEADLFVLTTCGFSQAIEDGDFEALEKIKKNMKPGAKVVLAGCIVRIRPDRSAKEHNGNMFDNHSYHLIDEIVHPVIPFEDIERPNNMLFSDRFFIEIQTGCPNRCSFCAIWKTQSKSISKPIEKVMEEFHKALNEGHKNIYFIGECAGAYGLDINSDLGELLKEVVKIDKDFRLVLEDVSPKYLHKCIEPLKILATQKKIELFHSPIQSGSDRILKLMNRTYDMNKFKEMILELRAVDPDITLSSAVIVGFPSETREEVDDSIKFCHDAGFNSVACHIFSKRPGAAASEMTEQIDHDEMVYRYRYFNSNFKGKTRIDPNQRKFVELV